MTQFQHDQKTIDLVNHIFERLIAMNPAFRVSWPTDKELLDTKREYMNAFHQIQLTDIRLIKKGLDACRLKTLPFVPSPGQFIEWCQPSPEDIGAPSIDEAYKEACLQARPQTWVKDWSHDAVKDAYRRTGNNSFLNEKSEDSKKKFSQHYLQVCQDYAAGRIEPQISHKRPFSKTDEGKPEVIGDYDFIRPGVLRQYDQVKTCEEAMAVIDNILGNGNGKLRTLVNKLESQYKAKNYL